MDLGSGAASLPADIEGGTIERARAGDQQALGAVYDWYLPRVYRYVLSRVGDVAEAEDLTEDIFLRMLSAIADYKRTNVPFSAWLFRIARNHVVSHYRRNGLRKNHGTIDETVADSRQDPASIVERQLMLGEVAEAVQRLPEAQRDVIALRFAVGLSVAETAHVLGKRQGNVKMLQHKAVARLQKVLLAEPKQASAEGLI
ncbi:MAG TPA: sigma-70 family RNA polymerase sigma factor [Dehalococcoidia bacterium]|nr:sigma-70 family RNA polymerase sigma factor [Dehalococcoidia bacterium]